MGLDMFLFKDIYVGGNYEHNNVTGSINLSANGRKIEVNLSRLSSIREEVFYWRKANAIHSWFVENLQDGVDNCGTYYISRNKLQSLCEEIWDVLQDKGNAKNILPARRGFFFGNEDYDDYYFDDLERTYYGLQSLLKESNSDNGDYYYHSSW